MGYNAWIVIEETNIFNLRIPSIFGKQYLRVLLKRPYPHRFSHGRDGIGRFRYGHPLNL